MLIFYIPYINKIMFISFGRPTMKETHSYSASEVTTLWRYINQCIIIIIIIIIIIAYAID